MTWMLLRAGATTEMVEVWWEVVVMGGGGGGLVGEGQLPPDLVGDKT